MEGPREVDNSMKRKSAPSTPSQPLEDGEYERRAKERESNELEGTCRVLSLLKLSIFYASEGVRARHSPKPTPISWTLSCLVTWTLMSLRFFHQMMARLSSLNIISDREREYPRDRERRES